MSQQRLCPVEMTQQELHSVLTDMTQRVEDGDSLEGSIQYEMPYDEDALQRGVYALVQASYRIGNTMGQGGMRIIGEWRDIESTLEEEA